jgi:hypothetical protein
MFQTLPKAPLRKRGIPVLMLLAATCFAAGLPEARAWDHAHGDSANTGFVDVKTAPAIFPVRVVGGLGFSAPGSGPVIAADGTVYVGNTIGELRAFHPNGDLKWQVRIPNRRGIVASPAIGIDGAIYVAGVLTVRDHRGGVERLRNQGGIYRFDPYGGAMVWVAEFPGAGTIGSAATTASPVIWRSGTTEVVIIPVLHPHGSLGLLAYSTAGALLFEQDVPTRVIPPITSEWSVCQIFCMDYWFGLDHPLRLPPDNPPPGKLPAKLEGPLPSVGIHAFSGAGDPMVVVADDDRHIVGYAFSPGVGFREAFRQHLANGTLKMSSPVLLRDGHSVIAAKAGEQAWTLFGGPNVGQWAEVKIPPSAATPTLTSDGRLVTVDRVGGSTEVWLISPTGPPRSVQFVGDSIAPAAASCTHVFVSTEAALYTLDARTLQPLVAHPWRGGGLSSPAIAPGGAVYALAGGELAIFKAPPGPPPVTAFTCNRPDANSPADGAAGGVAPR